MHALLKTFRTILINDAWFFVFMYDYTYWGLTSLSGMDNMALEEHFLQDSAEKKTAHMRFYDFSKDTVVLGYSQATDAVKKWSSDFHVVRRASGGSHVHVGKNVLAYSFIVPRDGSFVNHQDFRIYYADKVAQALEQAGLSNITTDHRASTIMKDGKVIASHAVTWGVKSALLHGLIMIDPYNMQSILNRIKLNTRMIGNKTYHEADALAHIPTVTKSFSELKPHATPEQKTLFCKQLLTNNILHSVAKTNFKSRLLTNEVLSKAELLQRTRYATERWVMQRDPTFTPEQIEEMPGEKLDGPLNKNQGYCLYIQVPDKDFKNMTGPD